MRYEKVLKDEDNIQRFINKYNERQQDDKQKIPQDHFKFIFEEKIARGRYIELLGRYGDPSIIELPQGLKND